MTGYTTEDDVRYRPGGDNGVLRLALCEEWKYRCYWCERPTLFGVVEIDHIVPHTVGADQLLELIRQHGLPAGFDVHSPANLAPICGTCNREKSDHRLPGTLVTGKLVKAASKQKRVIRRVLRFAAANQRSVGTVAVGQALSSSAEVAAQIRLLTERSQAFSDAWRQDFTTTAEGIILTYTPKPGPHHDETGLPPLFDLSSADDAAAALIRGLGDVRDYGGELTVDARYLIQSGDDTTPSIAEVLGVTGPGDQVQISAGRVRLDPASTFQLALVTVAGAVRDRIALHADPVRVGRLGARLALHDGAAVFTVSLQAERPDLGGTVTTHLASSGLAGRPPFQLMATLRLFQQAEPTDRLEVRLDDRTLGQPVDTDAAAMGEIVMALRHDTEIVAALDRIQAHTDQRFVVPQQITAAERADLLLAARLLDGETITLTDDILAITVSPDGIDTFLQAGPNGQPGDLRAAGAGYVVTCGAHRMDLGSIAVHAPHVALVNADELRAAAKAGTMVKVRYRCQSPDKVRVRLASPDALPERQFP